MWNVCAGIVLSRFARLAAAGPNARPRPRTPARPVGSGAAGGFASTTPGIVEGAVAEAALAGGTTPFAAFPPVPGGAVGPDADAGGGAGGVVTDAPADVAEVGGAATGEDATIAPAGPGAPVAAEGGGGVGAGGEPALSADAAGAAAAARCVTQ